MSSSVGSATASQIQFYISSDETLHSNDSSSLTELPTIPLDLSNSSSLTEPPTIPLNLSNNTSLTERSLYAHWINRSNSFVDLTSMRIDVEKLTTEPQVLLCALGQYLLNNQPFPTVKYYLNNDRSTAIDAGGVRRDFMTRLCENIFKKVLSEDEKGKFLKRDDEMVPISIVGDEAEKNAYKTLGSVLALCYADDSFFKTGPLFDENVYGCLIGPGDPGSDPWFLNNLLKGKLPPSLISFLISQEGTIPEFTQQALETLTYFVTDNPSPFTQEYVEAHLEILRESLLEVAKRDRKLLAISWMAQEMKKRLDPQLWATIPALGVQVIKDKIEGVLNAEALKLKLKWKFGGVDRMRFQITKNYLETWIDQNARDRLELFVRAVTGNKTLSAAEITVKVFNRGSENLPVTHTCSSEIELSANYQDQEQFNAKLGVLLNEGMAGTGFSFV